MIEGSPIVPKLWFNQSVHFRKGAISLLKGIDANDILVVAYPEAKENESYVKAISNLEGKTVHEEICQSATQAEINKIREKYVTDPPDLIIGIGGGQVMDSAKILRILLENPERSFENLLEGQLAERSIQYIAIPTTPSTGSEANGTAVIKDATGTKIPFISSKMIPDDAILDASFLVTLSDKMIFTFLGDIFGHANESILSKLSNPMVQLIGWGIIDLLKQVSSELKDKPGDIKALDKLMQAGYLGGLISGSVFVGVCHALAHTLEQINGTPHSTGVLTLTPKCLSWQFKVTEDPVYQRLSKDFEEIGLHDYVAPQILEDLDKQAWAEQTLNDPAIKTSSVRMKEENLMELIEWVLS